ncbi:hypothetical protein HZS_3249 [Henneguya salminicola]|nr:hypothetical protein HZS_3249 [Henneguya salminicola]
MNSATLSLNILMIQSLLITVIDKWEQTKMVFYYVYEPINITVKGGSEIHIQIVNEFITDNTRAELIFNSGHENFIVWDFKINESEIHETRLFKYFSAKRNNETLNLFEFKNIDKNCYFSWKVYKPGPVYINDVKEYKLILLNVGNPTLFFLNR